MALYSSMIDLAKQGQSPLGSLAPKVTQAMNPVPAVGGMARPTGTWAALSQGINQKRAGAPVPGPVPGVPAMPGSQPNIGVQPAAQTPAAPPAPPAPLPMPVQSNTAQLSRVNPANDLRSVQIAPTAGPSRSQIALDRLKSFDMDTADTRQRGIQDIGRNAARLGRLGSGMVTTDLGSLEERLGRAREQMLLNLSADTAEGEIGDARMDRGELRTERGYQTGRADNAIDRNVQQRLLEDSLLNSQFGRDRVLANAEFDYADNAEGNSEGAFDALGELLRSRAMGQATDRSNILDQIGGTRPPATLPGGSPSIVDSSVAPASLPNLPRVITPQMPTAAVPKSILDRLKVS